jgi:hypothetical protein
MRRLFILSATTALILGGAVATAADLPVYELQGLPITPHQTSVVGSANIQERSPTPSLTLGGMPASPHQVAVLRPHRELKGVLNAAIVKFKVLDKDHKGRLTQEQLAQELTPQEFKEANPDNDTTIGAQEWFALVSDRFEAADTDRNGSLTIDELQTPAGKALLKLID